MIALIRYALLKSFRESQMAMIVLAPSVMLGSPLLVMGIIDMARGRGGYPFTIIRTSAAVEAMALTHVAAALAALAAGSAGFTLFRTEVAHRMIGALALAARTSVIAASAVVAGAALGMISFGVAVVAILALTTSVASGLPAIALATTIACVVAAAGGILLCSISADYGMLVSLFLFLPPVIVAVFASPLLEVTAAVLLASIVFIAVASFFLERKCAS